MSSSVSPSPLSLPPKPHSTVKVAPGGGVSSLDSDSPTITGRSPVPGEAGASRYTSVPGLLPAVPSLLRCF